MRIEGAAGVFPSGWCVESGPCGLPPGRAGRGDIAHLPAPSFLRAHLPLLRFLRFRGCRHRRTSLRGFAEKGGGPARQSRDLHQPPIGWGDAVPGRGNSLLVRTGRSGSHPGMDRARLRTGLGGGHAGDESRARRSPAPEHAAQREDQPAQRGRAEPGSGRAEEAGPGALTGGCARSCDRGPVGGLHAVGGPDFRRSGTGPSGMAFGYRGNTPDGARSRIDIQPDL